MLNLKLQFWFESLRSVSPESAHFQKTFCRQSFVELKEWIRHFLLVTWHQNLHSATLELIWCVENIRYKKVIKNISRKFRFELYNIQNYSFFQGSVCSGESFLNCHTEYQYKTLSFSMYKSDLLLILSSDWLASVCFVKMNMATSALSSCRFWMKSAISMAPLTCLLMVETLDWRLYYREDGPEGDIDTW